MIPNNNLSVLPFYADINEQNAQKWWVYGRVYPLFTPAGFILPFQIITEHSELTSNSITGATLFNAETGEQFSGILSTMQSAIIKKEFPSLGYDVWVYKGLFPVVASIPNGRYFLLLTWGSYEIVRVSEIFTVVNDIQPYLKIEWWDNEDFVMDAGTIVYTNPAFKNVLYLQSDLAKPEYVFEEEGDERDGYFFPIKQISEKRYRFSFFAPEYLLDVMRFIRMADHAEITYHGQKYSLDTFLITPEWENNGDVAAVQAEFETATVAKKLSVGYVRARRGDFNDDFNNDFNNQ